MVRFANRLNSQDIKEFIEKCKFQVDELVFSSSSKHAKKEYKGFFKVSSYKFNFVYDDFMFKLIGISYNSKCLQHYSNKDAHITVNDWRSFMRHKFGDEYLKAFYDEFGKRISPTEEFVTTLTSEDISKLFNTSGILSHLVEVDAFEVGSRRFKYFCNYRLRELVIAPYYHNGEMSDLIEEEEFVKFMYEKFGKDFAGYYLKCIDTEFGIINERLAGYQSSKENEKNADADEVYRRDERVHKSFRIARRIFN